MKTLTDLQNENIERSVIRCLDFLAKHKSYHSISKIAGDRYEVSSPRFWDQPEQLQYHNVSGDGYSQLIIDPLKREAYVYAWKESHHNGDSYDEQRAPVPYTDAVGGKALKALMKVVGPLALAERSEQQRLALEHDAASDVASGKWER